MRKKKQIESREEPTDAVRLSFNELCLRLWEAKLKQLPLTMKFDQLRFETSLGKSTAYEIIKDDEYFPQAIPLTDGDRSKRWWSHRVIAWVIHRDPNCLPEFAGRLNHGE